MDFWQRAVIVKRAEVWSIDLYHPHHLAKYLASSNPEELEMLHRTRYFQANYPSTCRDAQLLQVRRF
jgi:hypothetical protein